MLGFVFGFLSELAREFGDWLDRLLPAPRLRRALRSWRRRRPFWAAMWVIGGGVEMVAIPLAPLPLMIKVGVGAMSAVGIGLVLTAGGLFFLFKPDQRLFVSVVTAIASLTSMATTNLGGFGIGMLAGLIGSSMAFGWMPAPAPADDGPTPGTGTDAKPPHTVSLGAGGREGGVPKAREDRPRPGRRRGRARGTVLFVVSATVLAAGLPAAGSAAAPSPYGAAAPGSGVSPFPWPTLTRPWDPAPTPAPTSPGREMEAPASAPTGSAGATGTPGPPSPTMTPEDSAKPGDENDEEADKEEKEKKEKKEDAAKGARVTLPCLTGIDTGGLPNPGEDPGEAEPGEIAEDPDDLTALWPPIVIGDQPGRPRATYPISPGHPEVGADSLTAYGAIIHGATYLSTVDGHRMKVLWVHADRLVADNYRFRVETGSQVQTIDVDLDIPQVDIYVTRLTGSITIPVLNVSTPRICIGADIVPANLPIAVQLPRLSVTAVEAGQVLVDAETVNFSELSVSSHRR
ncbi:DUF6114 domain-containing protein [Streptomyces sp. GC420]|uniref:DUF6114 domain-containing protein n=1 Tax=Streptomyces sp. GC420 TaxID=2697568 RepID=UPI0014152C7A|nr:DUF6114 domain-containing protein [Streptomyces sp. GC420]NBM19634.1 hypothetical protein [Streptomyces sp. GC420]